MEPFAASDRDLGGRRLFISHSNADAKVVEWIAAQVRALGVIPYLAEEDVRPGTLLAAKVRAEIDRSDAVLVLLTQNGASSKYVQQEIGAANQAGKPILAFVEAGAELGDLAMLAGVEYVVFDHMNLADSSAHVTRALTHLAEASGQHVPRRVVVPTEPVLQLQLSAELELTAGQLLFGVVVFSAVVGLIVVAAHSDGPASHG